MNVLVADSQERRSVALYRTASGDPEAVWSALQDGSENGLLSDAIPAGSLILRGQEELHGRMISGQERGGAEAKSEEPRILANRDDLRRG